MPPFDPESINWVFRDESGNEVTDPETIIEVQRDIIRLSLVFGNYIKQNDPELWKRATDYAVDLTKSKVAKFIKAEEQTDGTE